MIKLKDILRESTQVSSSPGTKGYTGFLPSEIWDKYKRELSVSIKNTTGYSIVGLDKIPPDTIKKTDNPINKKDVSDKNISETIKLKNLLTEVVCGQCFRWAYRKVLKGGPLLNLVHGTIHAPFLNKRINHAWVETKNRVFDWQNHESKNRKYALANIGLWVDVDDKTKVEYYRKGFPKKLYYKMTKAKVDDKYKKMEAAITMMKNKHLGPWD